MCHETEPTVSPWLTATRATGSSVDVPDTLANSRLLVPVSPATSSTLQPSPTASRRISSGSTLLASSAAGSIDSAAGTACGASVHASLASILSSADSHNQPSSQHHHHGQRAPSPDESTVDGQHHSGREREAISSGAAAVKKRKMPIINPLVTLPMWPSKL